MNEQEEFEFRARAEAEASTPAAPQASPAAAPYSFSDFLKNTGSNIVRPIANAVMALPTTAMDAGLQTRSFLEHPHVPSLSELNPFSAAGRSTGEYPSQSQAYAGALDSVTRAPTSTVGKIAEAGSSIIAGAGLPQGSVLNKVPDNFMPAAQAARQQALAVGQRNGLVAPPSQSNPSFTNRLLEGLGGKLKLNQEATLRNDSTFARMAAESIGQNPEAPMTQGSLAAVRGEAAAAGSTPLRGLGQIQGGDQLASDLDKIVATSKSASNSFPGIKAPDLNAIVAPLKVQSFNSAEGLDAISQYRQLADQAYRGGDAISGKAYKSAATALEDAIERHLVGQGEDGMSMLNAFRDARVQMAKTYDIGKALNESTGQVNAMKLAAINAKNPGRLSGELKDIATFASAFPKASKMPTENYPAISPLDAYGSAIAAGASHSVMPLAIPLTRVGIRQYLLSESGQLRAVQQPPTPDAGLGVLSALPQFGLASVSR
jgi:hypothetical protein